MAEKVYMIEKTKDKQEEPLSEEIMAKSGSLMYRAADLKKRFDGRPELKWVDWREEEGIYTAMEVILRNLEQGRTPAVSMALAGVDEPKFRFWCSQHREFSALVNLYEAQNAGRAEDILWKLSEEGNAKALQMLLERRFAKFGWKKDTEAKVLAIQINLLPPEEREQYVKAIRIVSNVEQKYAQLGE